MRKRLNASEVLYKWKLIIKLQNKVKLQAVRNNNVKKLKFILNEWCEFIDIVSKYIVIYNFFQNDVIERGIKTSENQIRIMLQNVKLFIKFWFEIKETDAYVRNRVITDSMIDEKKN